jgi:hypothetical protein
LPSPTYVVPATHVLVGAVHVLALGAAALVRVLALVLVDAEGAAGVQLVAARAHALEAAVGVLARARRRTNALKCTNHI